MGTDPMEQERGGERERAAAATAINNITDTNITTNTTTNTYADCKWQ